MNKLIVKSLGEPIAEIVCDFKLLGNMSERDFVRLFVETHVTVEVESGSREEFIRAGRFVALLSQEKK